MITMNFKKFTFLLCALTFFGAQAQTITNYTTADGLISDNVNCVDVDAADNVWFGTQLGVSMFDGTTWTNYESGTYPDMIDNNIQAIFIDSNDDLWLGTDFGINHFDGTTWMSYNATDGLGNEQIKCINEDLSGNMWFGTSGGLSEFDGSTFTNYGTAEGIPFGGVNTVTVEANGDLWIGTGLDGIRIYDGTSFTEITETEGLISNKMRAIAISADDKKWVGTSDGITVLNASDAFYTNHTTMFTLPAPDTLNPVEDIKIDGNGNVWVGVYVDYLVTEGGVSVYNGNTWLQFDVSDGLAGPVVRQLAIDSNNDVWVVTSTGVSLFTDMDYVGLEETNSVSNFSIYPNPANTDFTIQFKEEIDENVTIEIYNSFNQLVKIETITGGLQTTIAIDDLAQGIYFVKINNELKKLVVQK